MGNLMTRKHNTIFESTTKFINTNTKLDRKTKLFTQNLNLKTTKHKFVNTSSLSDAVQKVSSFLSAHEHSYTVQEPSAIKGYVTNQLAANDPLEDTRAEAKFLNKNGMMFGVYDGHGGASCARVLAKRLFDYIAVPLLSTDQRKKFILENDEASKVIEPLNDLFEWKENRVDVYNRGLKQWANSLDYSNTKMGIPEAMKKAFDRLDTDIGKAGEEDRDLSLGVAMSGAVACVAVVSGIDLHIGFAGDCQAVLGQQSSGGAWNAKKLTTEHTCDNEIEKARIKNAHPPSERLTLIKDRRLFQSLAPLRSFGDYRYKWTIEQLEKTAVPKYGREVIPPNYATPPYLTATPDVSSLKLTEKDKFLVIGSDGLWDILTPQMVVQLVGDHMTGKSSMLQLQLHKFKDLFPGKDCKRTQELRPVDKSAATHLIRAALGGDHEVVSKQLSFPLEHVRIIRDDMTVTVIYFNSDYIASHPTDVDAKESIKDKKPGTNEEKGESMINSVEVAENINPNVINAPVKVLLNDPTPKPKEHPENEKISTDNKLTRWEKIEEDEKQINFNLEKAVDEGGYTYKSKTLKAKVERKIHKVKKPSVDFSSPKNFKNLQILSLRNESLKTDIHLPNPSHAFATKDEAKIKDMENEVKLKLTECNRKD